MTETALTDLFAAPQCELDRVALMTTGSTSVRVESVRVALGFGKSMEKYQLENMVSAASAITRLDGLVLLGCSLNRIS